MKIIYNIFPLAGNRVRIPAEKKTNKNQCALIKNKIKKN